MNASQVNFDPPPVEPQPRSFRPTVSLPQLWIGFALAASVIVFELSAGILTAASIAPAGAALYVAAWAIYLSGLVYWYFWLYRVHKFLATMFPTYPISPQKAVGYRLIPFYNLTYWNFRWTNQIADFVRQKSKVVTMPKGWVGVWLIIATLLAVFDRGLELIVLFAVSAYLTNKIRKSLSFGPVAFAAAPAAGEAFDIGDRYGGQVPDFEPFAAAAPVGSRPVAGEWNFDLAKQWGLPVSAGVGAAFGFLMCYGFWLLTRGTEVTVGTFALNVLVVAVVLYFYLEPLADKLLEDFGAAGHHVRRKFWQRLFRFGVFVVIVDVAHSLLERATEQSGGFQVAEFGFLFTVFFGGMTFLWIVAGARTKLHEALAVVAVGTVVLVSFGYGVVNKADSFLGRVSNGITQIESTESKDVRERFDIGNLAKKAEQAKNAGLAQLDYASSREVGAGIVESDRSKRIDGGVGLLCAVCVALAGFVAMRRTFKPIVVAGTVFGTAVLVGVIFGLISGAQKYHVVTGLWAAYWWCMGMLVLHEDHVFRDDAEVPEDLLSERKEKRKGEFPHAIWMVSCVILIGLVGAAYSLRPPGTEIGSRVLTLRGDGERAYGAPNPQLKFSAGGLTDEELQAKLDGQPAAYVGASVDSPVGTYPTFLTQGTAEAKDKQYRLDFLPGTLTIYQARTKTAVASNPSNAVANSPVTLTATIVSTDGAGTPGGRVTFYSDSSPLGTQTVSNGSASLAVSGLMPGDHTITAAYSGDTNFARSDSPSLTEVIHEPEHRPMDANRIIVPAGTEVDVITQTVIDSNTSVAGEPLLAQMLSSKNPFLSTQQGGTAILGLSNIDREGFNGARPSMAIHLTQLQVAGQNYKVEGILLMQGAPQGRAGHIFIPAKTRLTFKLLRALKVDRAAGTSSLSNQSR